jgi:hypothetical protein
MIQLQHFHQHTLSIRTHTIHLHVWELRILWVSLSNLHEHSEFIIYTNFA